VGNGGLLPVATPEASVDLGDYGVPIQACDVPSVIRALEACEALAPEERLERTLRAIDSLSPRHTVEAYRQALRDHLDRLLA
jgi:hypothetical protein